MMLSTPETATVLAALRYWQRRVVMSEGDSPNPVKEIRAATPEHFVGHQPLDAKQIDVLCERLNTNKTPIVHLVVADRPGDTVENRFYEACQDRAAAEIALKTIRTEQPEWDSALIDLEVLG